MAARSDTVPVKHCGWQGGCRGACFGRTCDCKKVSVEAEIGNDVRDVQLGWLIVAGLKVDPDGGEFCTTLPLH